jgi:hypothetical protein
VAKDVKFKIMPDGDAALRENAKLTNQIDRMKQKLREVGQESRRSGQQGRSAFAGITSQVTSLATGMFSVGGIIQALRITQAELRKTAEEGEKTVTSLQAGIGAAGDIALYPHIERTLRTMKGPGAAQLTMPQRGEVFAATRGGDPGGNVGDALDIAETAAQSMVVYGSIEETKRMAAIMARLHQAAPSTSTGDLADLATFLPQAAGEHVNQLDKTAFKGVRQLMTQGVGLDEALGMMLAGMESQQGARAFSSYASYLERGKTGTLQPAARTMLEQYGRRDYAGMVRGAREGDVFESQVETARGIDDLRLVSARRRARAKVSLAEYDDRAEPIEYATKADWLSAHAREGGMPTWARKLGEALYWLRATVDISSPGGTGGAGSAYAERVLDRAMNKIELGEETISRLGGKRTVGPANEGDRVGP